MKKLHSEEARSLLPAVPVLAALAIASSAQMGEDPPPPVTAVARLRFEVPQTPYADAPEMVVRGTIPVPPGVYLESDPVPFKLVDPFGTPVTTQVEIVTRYADSANDGVDVAEVLARVERDPNWVAGTRETLDVVVAAGGSKPDPGTPDLTDLTNALGSVTSDVQALLSVPQAVGIVGHGPQGEIYVCYPLDGTGTIRNDRYGPIQSGVRVYQGLGITSYVEGDLRSLAGVHSYLETVTDENALRLNLRFNNANDNATEAPGDNPRGEVYFDRLSLYLIDDGRDWAARQEFVDPFGMTPSTTPTSATLPGSPHTYRVYPLVSSLGNGKYHVMFCKDQWHRRLVIAPEADWEAAAEAPQRLLHHEGQAFSMWGQDSFGNPLWSWWNPATARYFPQRHLLAKLNFSNGAYTGGSAMRAKLTDWYVALRTALATDTPIASGPFNGSAGQLGWARPLYDPYSGTTGGQGIQYVDGDRTAAVASLNGYRFLVLRHRLINERMRNVLYGLDGDPTSYDDFVGVHTGSGEPFYKLQNGFQMDFGDADLVFCPIVPLWNQNNYVGSNNGKPPYYATLKSYDPIDKQHGSRYDSPNVAIALLGNDPLAKDDVRAQAELFRMTYSEHPNQAGNSAGWSLSGACEDVLPNLGGIPAWGFWVGRGEGWGLQSANAAFALGSDAVRVSFGSWYLKVAELFHVGLGLTSDPTFVDPQLVPYPWAFLSAKVNDKLYGTSADVRARQPWEDMILAIALRGMEKSVFADTTTEHGNLGAAADALHYGFLAPVAWNEVARRPWDVHPVTPLVPPTIFNCDPTVANCSGQNPLPAAYPPYGTGNTSHYAFAPFGDGAGETGDPLFFQRAYQTLTGSTCGNCPVALKGALEDLDPRSNYSGWSNMVHLLGLLQ
jgi:hypothetical protein